MNKSVLLFCSLFLVINCDVYLENFQENTPPIYTWEEMSDTVMPQGKSKSSFVLLKTENISRAILFTLLDPQVGGAGFVGIRKKVKLNLTDCEAILMNQKGQGQYKGYEICLRHYGKSGLRVPAYCFYFQATEDFKTITMPLDEFKPYIEGKIIDNYPPLDKSNITQITILFYGGAHLPKNLQQSGTASLAINWIKRSRLILIGGKTANENVRNILREMIDHSLALHLNWSGKGLKHKFEAFKNINNLIIEAVTSKFDKESKSSIENYVKIWLRNATDREGGRKKRLLKEAETQEPLT